MVQDIILIEKEWIQQQDFFAVDTRIDEKPVGVQVNPTEVPH